MFAAMTTPQAARPMVWSATTGPRTATHPARTALTIMNCVATSQTQRRETNSRQPAFSSASGVDVRSGRVAPTRTPR